MDVLLPPPGLVKDNTKRLSKVLENLNLKIDRFNTNIEKYDRHMLKPPPVDPAPKKFYIPKYITVIFVIIFIYMVLNRKNN